MNNWPGKTVIGLGGSVGTGKESLIQLLEGLGALTIEIRDVANQVIQRGTPGYQQIVEKLGKGILKPDGQINKSKLYYLVKTDIQTGSDLRSIIDPIVNQATIKLIDQTDHSLIFITATNLSRFGLIDICDHIWVVSAPEEKQIAYLSKRRGWSREKSRMYIYDQPPVDVQLEFADLILYNRNASELHKQISQALHDLKKPTVKNESSSSGDTDPRSNIATNGLAVDTRNNSSSTNTFSNQHESRKDSSSLAYTDQQNSLRSSLQTLKSISGRLINILITLFVIAYLTFVGLILAERGREYLPAQPLQASWQAWGRIGDYIINHPQTYYWHKENVAAFQVVSQTLKASTGLLLLALCVAILLGLPLGIAAALTKRRASSTFIMLISTLGISTPSFLFAMFLWVVNIWVHRTFDIKVLPSAGFGWDAHLIMPVLVLAMRPLAQITQVTYVSMREIMQQDYIRTAHSKGISNRLVRNVHALPNILIPCFTTLGSSLRYSLASLPIVELFFGWPGVGFMLLEAIQQGNDELVADLILSLGLFFLFVNLLIEFSFPLIDARLRRDVDTEDKDDQEGFFTWVKDLWNALISWLQDLRYPTRRITSGLTPLPSGLKTAPVENDVQGPKPGNRLLRILFSNPALILGSLMMIALIGLMLFGENLTDANPYQINGIMMIEGEIGAPPYGPSSIFPWGTDHIGRDIQALVLAGGKRTLTLAFFGMMARLAIGILFGILAGWLRGRWIDRLVSGAVGVWAAFPLTLFAMIIIQALGIQQGMWVFVVAISIVGWGEVAQYVRGQVIALKPKLFIESARSIGSHAVQILVRHIIPNLMNSFIVLASLEMGGILMLLAELGYLNIFMGGGFRAMIGESGRMVPIIAFYSDVPEWSALIANVRQYWRSYSWMALYPGLAVFFSIMTFNIFGEGLRRFLEDSHANLSRLLNRYTLIIVVVIVVIIAFLVQSSLPMSVYRSEGEKFDASRVMQDIQALSSSAMQGRETGMPGADLAALFIAYRMEEIGIFPAGEKHTYLQHLVQPRVHLFEIPTLSILDESGQSINTYEYKKDFTEISRYVGSIGEEQANIMGVSFGSPLDPSLSDEFGLSNSAAMDHIIIVHAGDLEKVNSRPVKGILVIADESYPMERRDVYPLRYTPRETARPFILISPDVADTLLQTAGTNLEEFNKTRTMLEAGKMALTEEGVQVSISLLPRRADNFLDEDYINVIGVIPGQGRFMGMEEQVIIVSAYYDGLGTDLMGTVYHGANDNASGVATMLELARLLKESDYQPDKTVLFVAWAGGERQEGLSIVNVLNARPGASELTVETVIELSGVGYGTGNSINLGNDSSFRLVKLFQEAASRYNLPTTTRGRNPHYGMPLPTAFGGRDAMTLSISWDGSDSLAHTPGDTYNIIDPTKLDHVGRATYLTLLVMSRETDY